MTQKPRAAIKTEAAEAREAVARQRPHGPPGTGPANNESAPAPPQATAIVPVSSPPTLARVSPQQQLMGIAPEREVPVKVRVYSGMKLALWRSKVGWEIAQKQATEILTTHAVRHAAGCPAAADEAEPCLEACPDREVRMSALVILSAARQHAPVSASKLAEQPYMMPSREFVSALVAELAACQAELETLRGSAVTAPPPNDPNQENTR